MDSDLKILPVSLVKRESKQVGVRYACVPMLVRVKLLDLRSRII